MSTVVIPTLGRPSLAGAILSLKSQTQSVSSIIVKEDSRDTLIKIKEAVNECGTDYFVIADDDAHYPMGWIAALSSQIEHDSLVGFVGGPCLPYVSHDSTDAEKAIAKVTSSYFGTSNLSYRWKANGGPSRDADETNLVGNGMYRTKVLRKILNEEYDKIPIAAYETYIFTRIRQLGYRTILNPNAYFFHRQRTSLRLFASQIFRCGTGRMNYFKKFPYEAIKKFYIFFPLLMVLDTVAMFFFLPLAIPWAVYIGCALAHGRLWKYYVVMHYSYGFGMLYGVFRVRKTWG